MSATVPSVLSDERTIVSISVCNGQSWYAVGRDEIERIVAYAENGEMARVPWFAVVKNGQIAYRVPGHAVDQVAYANGGSR